MSSIVAFHIGPVQDFIATARRTQDLWIGSWLLSYLTREAISEFDRRVPGSALLAPCAPPTQLSAIADTPNHFVIKLPDSDGASVATEVEEAVRTRFSVIAKDVRDCFLSPPRPTVQDELWERQIATALELFWVSLPDTGVSQRNAAYAALASRKSLRDFAYQTEPGFKCTQCGLRQELSAATSQNDSRGWWKNLLEFGKGQRLRIRPDGNERLCAVCFVKRAAVASDALPNPGRDDGSFPSTSSVASAHWRSDVLRCPATEALLKDYIACIGLLGIKPSSSLSKAIPELYREFGEHTALNYDGDLFYAETLESGRLRDEFPEYDPTLAEGALEELRKVYKRADQCNLPSGARPARYYAVLAMDGDHMGAFFGAASDEQARSMSEAVSSFARSDAIKIVERHYGRVVYAGGDDLLALLPMMDALPCAEELAAGFDDTVRDIPRPARVKQPSVSIGIALAHHTSPLQVAIEEARAAERSAKRRYGRGAVCLHVLKRSGEEVHVGSAFSLNGQSDKPQMRPLQVVTEYMNMLSVGDLAGKFPTALAAETRGLAGSSVPLDAAARESRVRWIARRHAVQGAEVRAEQIGSALSQWADGMAARTPGLDMEEVARWAGVGRFIAKGGSDDR